MKKYFVLIIALILIPFNVNAVKLDTKVLGDSSTNPGNNIIYTIIVDQPLNTYKAELTYDRDVLNLVEIKEININTTTKKFDIDKSDSVIINVNSDNISNIIYTVEFKVKESTSLENAKFGIKTLLAKTNDSEFSLDEVSNTILINSIDNSSNKDLIIKEDKKLSKILTDFKQVVNDYGDLILYISIGLNLILIIALISSIRRKKVDYDF